MKLNFIFIMIGALALATTAVQVHAEDEAELQALRKEVNELRAELARLSAGRAAPEPLAELQRRIDLLAAELEKERSGGAVTASERVAGLAPAASKVYRAEKGVSIGGYGEALYENFAKSRQDGAASGRSDRVDFLRQILYVGYKFDDRILFNSELEFEHGSTGEGGEVSVEFAYVDWKASSKLGFRAGMLLVPVGFLNEWHEPPIFQGARRPEVESAILPSTWRENGAGLYGEAGAFAWRAYLVGGLSSGGLSASGIRGARQNGARSLAEDFAVTGRVDFSGAPGLLLGASFFTGASDQGARVEGRPFDARVSVFDVHAQYLHRGLELRALYARGSIGDAALVNAANGLASKASVGTDQYGWYVQGAFDVLSLGRATQWSLTPFVRYEGLDAQDGVPSSFVDDPATRRRVFTLGLGVKPVPNVAIKADVQRQRNGARTGVAQWNIALGYLF